MPGCCVKKCGRNSSSPGTFNGKPVTFHQFPADEERKDIWADAVRSAGKKGRKGDTWSPNRNSKICSVHFIEDQIERTFSKKDKSRPMTKLKIDAVPSIFPKVEPSQKEIKVSEMKSVVLPDTLDSSSNCSLPTSELEKSELELSEPYDTLQLAVADIDLSDCIPLQVDLGVTYNLVEGFDLEGNPSQYTSLENACSLPLQILADDPSESKPNEKRKIVVMPRDGGETIYFPQSGMKLTHQQNQDGTTTAEITSEITTPDTTIGQPASVYKAKPFMPSDAELQQAGPSTPSEDDDDACCGGYTDLDNSLCSLVKAGGTEDLAKEFRSGMESLQMVQAQLIGVLPQERLKKFGLLLEHLSKAGRELLKESKIISDQFQLFKRYQPPQVSNDNAKRPCERQQDESQANSTVAHDLDQVDVVDLDLDEETFKAIIDGIYK